MRPAACQISRDAVSPLVLWLARFIEKYCKDVYVVQHRAILSHPRSSATNSSSGLIFVKSERNPGGFFAKNLGKIRAKIRAKLNFVILSSFYDLGHVQTGILRFGEQLHNALNVH